MNMQCKDIPDGPLLAFIAAKEREKGGWVNWWDFDGTTYYGLPRNLFLAKMGRLITRGLLDGCACGCRGDWEITDKGKAALREGL